MFGAKKTLCIVPPCMRNNTKANEQRHPKKQCPKTAKRTELAGTDMYYNVIIIIVSQSTLAG